MVLPLLASQSVEVTCPHCAHVNVRLAASVKRGVTLRCESCRRQFRASEIRTRMGTAKR